MHWNANSIDSNNGKYFEFIDFVNKNKPLLISINETKLSRPDSIELANYQILRLDNTSRSGGIAVFINNCIKYEQTSMLDDYNLELIAVKILCSDLKFYFISWYLPPNGTLPPESFFIKLCSLKDYIVARDLNRKSNLR